MRYYGTDGEDMYKNLKDYIARLEREGELVRIRTEVDPRLEIAELTDREAKRPGGGRALLFERTGTDFPVLTNMMGSERRMALALGVMRLDELAERLSSLFAELVAPKERLMDKLRMLPLLEQMSRWMPRNRSGRGACQEVVWTGDEIRLSRLPVLHCWPFDGGRFVTLPLVHTVDPDTGIRNVGMYRMQLFSETETGMHWHLHKTGERHYRRYKELGRRMPVAVCLGGDPAYTYAATAPVPDQVDEYLLAGFLRQRSVELVRCLTSELRVPADCDFVLEGYVDPNEPKRTEGPFGDHTGFYSLEDEYPVFHLTAITHRQGAVYPATLVGIPPQEDAYIARATEKIFFVPIQKTMLPEMEDLYMPYQGVAHNIALVSIRRSYAGQALKTAAMLWGAGQMMFNKYMVVAEVCDDIRDPEVLSRLMRRVSVPDDVLISRGPLDVLDHAAPKMGLGGKMVLDLTDVRDREPAPVVCPDQWTFCGGIHAADAAWAERWGVLWLYADRKEKPDAGHFLAANEVSGVPFVVLLDREAQGLSGDDLLWLASSNCDPSRDVRIEDVYILFDARAKAGGVNGFGRRWPNVVTSSPETIARVDERWAEYGLGERVASPSLRYLCLQRSASAEYDPEKE